ncbi:MAG: hypothetical protein IIZ98_06235, partial [Erysipelotrichaceae bacterium]|nr:hypothetical protein [Erysipelotrichaceae bacterium]
QSGTLFDLEKLNNICKTYLSKFSLEEMKEYLRQFILEYHKEDYDVYFGNEEKLDRILTLGMGLNLKKRRKDYINASQILESIALYYDEFKTQKDEYRFDRDLVRNVLRDFQDAYSYDDDNNTWFEKVKMIGEKYGFIADMKAYKANPEMYRGSVSDIAEIIRIAVTGQKNSPDLWTIMQILGEKTSSKRLQDAMQEL